MSVVHIEPKELQDNNLRVLKLRKKEFKRSLTTYFELGGYIFIIILYFKNISFIRFGTRMFLHKVISNPFPTNQVQLQPAMKKQLTKSFLYTIIAMNAIYLFLDLIFGVPGDALDSSFFNGSLTLQIIGETRPNSRLSYIYYNVIIFSFQFITLYLSCMLDTDADVQNHSAVLPESTYSVNQVEGDGYSGRVTVAFVHAKEIYDEITSYELSNESTEQYNDYMGNQMSINSIL